MKELFEIFGRMSLVLVLLFCLKYGLEIEISGHWFLQSVYLAGVMMIGWILYPKQTSISKKEDENE